MKKLNRPPQKSGSIKIGTKTAGSIAIPPARPVAKAKPMPIRAPTASKPVQAREGQGRRFYRVRDIAGPDGILPIGISTFWRWIANGYLPQPIRLGARCSVWDVEKTDQAIKSLEKTMRTGTR